MTVRTHKEKPGLGSAVFSNSGLNGDVTYLSSAREWRPGSEMKTSNMLTLPEGKS